MNKRYIVRLSTPERDELTVLIKRGKRAAYIIKHSLILLAVDADGPNSTDEEVARTLRCHKNTVKNVRQRFVEQGLEAALERKKQLAPSRQRVLDGEGEARLIAISRMTPPKGNARWTLKLLSDELVVQEVVESISEQTVRRTLKKISSSRT